LADLAAFRSLSDISLPISSAVDEPVCRAILLQLPHLRQLIPVAFVAAGVASSK
jgi:hypothetical protein